MYEYKKKLFKILHSQKHCTDKKAKTSKKRIGTYLVILGQVATQQQLSKIARVLPLSHPWSGNSKLDVASMILN